MSLDISASLLISELAPFPSLVQRLGRLNRRAREPDLACPALIVEPPDPRPYDGESLSAAAKELEYLYGRESSQRDLANALVGMEGRTVRGAHHALAQPAGPRRHPARNVA